MNVTRFSFSQLVVAYRCKQHLDSSLHLSLMAFVTQVMRCELVFQTIRNHVGFLVWVMLFLKVHEKWVVPLIHPFS
jgi:hypothetical protein